LNPQGFGATVTIWNNGAQQHAQSHCVRGYLSKSESYLHFGLGKNKTVDSIVVVWSDGKKELLGKQNANQLITVDYKNATQVGLPVANSTPTLFAEVDPSNFGIDYVHEENDFIDFNLQKTLPHKFSQYGPSIAVGDVNGDGLDDMVLASSSRFQGPVVLQQQANGKFTKKTLSIKSSDQMKEEDMGLLLFDADNDGDNDLYITRGSYQHDPGSALYQDVLCENDGKGNFKVVSNALPVITASGQNTKAADIDGDGDLDLFVGGRVDPKAYPKPGQSLLLRNDSKPGKLSFTDVSKQWSPALSTVGMVSDFLWTDFNNDNKPDLIIASEWSPLLFFKNTGKSFEKIEPSKEINAASGWWNSLLAVDVDQDGDMDYVAGNFGLNQYFKCSSGEPLRIYSKDFDNNGSYDAFISCYFPDSTGKRQEYFYHSKDDMQKQLILIRKKFEFYGDYGKATVKDVFTPEEMKDVNVLTANYMKSVWIENLGNEQFKIHELPMEAQFAPLYGMQAMDVNGDELTDLILTGNDFGMETSQGRADAFNGLVLLNDGNKKFKSIGFEKSGFLVPGDARSLSLVNIANATYLVSTENRKPIRFFKSNNQPEKQVKLMSNEVNAYVYYGGNKKQKAELTYGSSFLSQTTRNYSIPKGANKIDLYTQQGKLTRTINTP